MTEALVGNPEQSGIKDLVQVSEQDVMWAWAFGETLNPKWARRHQNISVNTRERLTTTLPQEFFQTASPLEREEIMEAFFTDSARGVVREQILPLECTWYQGKLSVAQLKDIFIVQWPLSEALTPQTRTVREFAIAFREGRFPPGDNIDTTNMQRMSQFDLTQAIGAPVVLSETQRPPYCAVDGITRLSTMILRQEAGTLDTKDIPITLGVTPRLYQWTQIPQQAMRASQR